MKPPRTACLKTCAVAALLMVGGVGSIPFASAGDGTDESRGRSWFDEDSFLIDPIGDTLALEKRYTELAAELREFTSCQPTDVVVFLARLFAIRRALGTAWSRDRLYERSKGPTVYFYHLAQKHQQLEAAVNAKMVQLLEDFLRRCCGTHACDAVRESNGGTGDRSGHSPGTGDATGTPSGGDGTHLWVPSGPKDSDAGAGSAGGGTHDGSWVPPGSTPGMTGGTPTGSSWNPGDAGHADHSTPPTGTGTMPPTTGMPPAPDTTSVPPQRPTTGDLSHPAVAICCERCPGTDWDRLYFPVPPDTDCQPGDVRRDDLTLGERGTCANPLTEEPGPPTYGETCCSKKTTQLLYNSAKSGDVNSQVGTALRAACEEDPCAGQVEPKSGTPMRLETSMLSSGTDTQGRNWVPEHPVLRLSKDRLKPCHTESFYVTKEATVTLAPAIFAAISADYADDARTAEASKGTSCHASEGGGRTKRETPQERAAKAAAIGLLASQAKGQIEGLRATFDVTGREAALKDAKLQADIVNEITQRRERLTMPVQFNADESSQ